MSRELLPYVPIFLSGAATFIWGAYVDCRRLIIPDMVSVVLVGLFAALMFLFVRLLPVISMAEMRELVHETSSEHGSHRAEGGG